MTERSAERIFGLDIIRSLAIIIVVLAHGNILFNGYFTEFPYIALPDGVDLFFIISGFLIGNILINLAEENQTFNFPIVSHFLIRRWFRTLPNYFLFLFINIILIYFGLIAGTLNSRLATYFVFFQNFYKPFDYLFWESWSLSVEEWFYMLFPLLLVFLFTLTIFNRKIQQGILMAIITFLLCPLFYRFFLLQFNLDWDLYFRKLVLTRFDTIGFGLLGAYLRRYYSAFWINSKNRLFFIGGVLLLFFLIADIQNMFFRKTFYFTCIGVSLLLILPKFESLKNEKIPFKPFQFISKISYSMYLINIPLVQLIYKLFSAENKSQAVLIYVVFWILLILLSYVVYRFYEKPLMNLRDRVRVNFSQNAQ